MMYSRKQYPVHNPKKSQSNFFHRRILNPRSGINKHNFWIKKKSTPRPFHFMKTYHDKCYISSFSFHFIPTTSNQLDRWRNYFSEFCKRTIKSRTIFSVIIRWQFRPVFDNGRGTIDLVNTAAQLFQTGARINVFTWIFYLGNWYMYNNYQTFCHI